MGNVTPEFSQLPQNPRGKKKKVNKTKAFRTKFALIWKRTLSKKRKTTGGNFGDTQGQKENQKENKALQNLSNTGM